MRRLVILFAAITLVAAACGSDDEPAAQSGDPLTTAADGGGSKIELAAKNTTFDQTDLAASAGTVTIAFDNQDDGVSHNLHVTGPGVDEKTEIEAGPIEQTLELELEPGTYSYVCDVHPQQMTGELEVT